MPAVSFRIARHFCFVVLFLWLATVGGTRLVAQPVVSSVNPVNNATDVLQTSNIDIAFSTTLNASTVNSTNIRIWGDQTGLLSTRGTYSVNGTTATFDYSSQFKPGELVTVSVTTGVQNTEGENLATTAVWQFRTAVDGGYGLFYANGQSLGYSDGYDVVLGDLDGDGDLDAIVGTRHLGNTVWHNDGTGQFTPAGIVGYSNAYALALGDIDNDGDLDIVIANDFGEDNEVWFNNGSGYFTMGQPTLGADNSLNIALGDLDGDGDLDVVVTNWGQGNTVWINDGTGVFAQSTNGTLGNAYTYGIALGDLDNDGDLDVVTSTVGDENRLWFNDGTGMFTTTTATLGTGQSFDVTLGDLDSDGDLDAVVANTGADNTVWFNDGAGQFSVSTATLGSGNNQAITLGDVDGDGDLDAIVARDSNETNTLWLNDGTGQFTLQTGTNLGTQNSKEIALGDLDGDGDLDAIVANGGLSTVWLNGPRLVIESVLPVSPASGDDITFTVRSENPDGTPYNVSTATVVGLSWNTSLLPQLGGVTHATIEAGTSTATITMSVFAPAATATGFTASVVSGDALTRTGTMLTVEPNCAPVVTTTSNDGEGSLRRAVAAVCTGGTITFATSGTITLTTGQLEVRRSMTIDATGASITVSGNSTSRAFFIYADAYTTIAQLSVINGYAGGDNGGAISNSGSLVLLHVTISGCIAGNNGGAISSFGSTTSNLTILNSVLSRNSAGNGGGAIVSNTMMTIQNSVLDSNTAGNNGGAIQSSVVLVLTDVVLNYNRASNNGGALNNSAAATLTNVTMSHNRASNNGGAITSSSSMLLVGSTISENSSNNTGGGISASDQMVVENTAIIGNTARVGGGIISSSQLTVSTATISRNTARSSGGGLSIANNRALLSNCTISENSAESGGGVDNNGTLTISHSTIHGNTATLYEGGGARSFRVLNVINTTFSNNTSAVSGGGIAVLNSGSILYATHATIAANHTTNEGGGIVADNNGTVVLLNSIVADNSAASGADIRGVAGSTVSSLGHNLIGTVSTVSASWQASDLMEESAGLAPLANYGGTTVTMRPYPGSPAIDAGVTTATITDQRGVSRTVGTAPDIGAVETSYQFALTGAPQATLATLVFSQPIGLTITEFAQPVTNAAVTFLAPVTGATVFFPNGSTTITLTTDILGSVSTTATAGATAGTVSVHIAESTEIFQLSIHFRPVVSTSAITLTTNEDTPVEMTVQISDDTPLSSLVLSVTSSNPAVIAPAGIVQLTTTGATTTFLIIPLPEQSGMSVVTVTGVDEHGYSGSTTFIVTVLPVNDAPIVNTIQTAIETNEDAATTLTISVSDIDNTFGELTVTATSSNETLIPNTSLIQTGATGATTSFVGTPINDASGVAQITVTVSDGEYSATTVFTVTVLPVDDAPMISSAQPVIETNEDTATTLTVSLSDIDNSFGELTVTATSSNEGIIANTSLVQTGATGATTSFIVTPVHDANGTAQITLTVSDGEYSATTVLTVTVLPTNDAPMVSSAQSVVETNEDTATTVTVSLSDIDNSFDELTVTAMSSNEELISNSGIIQSGTTGAATSFIVTPVHDANGTVQIVITVSDGEYSATTVLTLTVLSVDDAPMISSAQPVIETNEDTATTLTVSLSDIDNSFGELTVTAVSSNELLISNTSLVQTGATGATTSFVVMPVNDAHGTAQITVTVSDGSYSATTVVTVTVLPVNDTPIVSTVQPVIEINEDTATTLTISLSDIDNTFGELTVTATSSNETLVPNTSLVQAGATGATTSFVVIPSANVSGIAQITVTVSDGSYSATTVLTVVVLPINDAPTISSAQPVVETNEDTATTLSVSLSDIDNSLSELTVTATSSNEGIIANTSLVQTGATGATTSFVVTPVNDANGTAQITVTVSDGEYSATTVLTITVLPVNDAPVIVNNTGLTIDEGVTATIGTMMFAASDAEQAASELTFTVTAQPVNGILVKNGMPLQAGIFTQADVDAGTIRYQHNGSETTSDSFDFTVDDGDGGTVSATFVISVVPVNDNPVAVGEEDSICVGSSVLVYPLHNDSDIENEALTIAGVSKPQHGVVIVLPGDTTIIYTPDEFYEGSDSFQYSVSDGQGGVSTATITIVMRPAIIAEAGNDILLCTGGEASLSGVGISAVGGISFQWSPATGLSNPLIANPIARPDTTTRYILTVTDDNGCRATDTMTVTVMPAVGYSITNDTAVCAGGSVQLEATGGVVYLWNPTVGLDNPTIANPVASPGETTTYQVDITAASGCIVTTTVTVTVYNAVQAVAGPDVNICAGASVQLQASGGVQYSWSPMTGLSDPTSAAPVASPSVTTMYTVTVSNAAGCSSVSTLTVTVNPVRLDAVVFLEGVYSGGSMPANLQSQGLVPVQQPYNVAPFYYTGNEERSPSANNIVDWVLVEVRSQITPESVHMRRAALLRSDGHIVDTDGVSSVAFPTLAASSNGYYVVIRHRNHLAVMSAMPATTSDMCGMSYNFGSSVIAAYEDFMPGQNLLDVNHYGMVSGDINNDGIINAADRVVVRNDAGQLGYLVTDLSLDGIVNALDRVLVRNNTFRVSQVP